MVLKLNCVITALRLTMYPPLVLPRSMSLDPLDLRTNPNYSSLDPWNDVLGRSRVMVKGKEICNNFIGERGCIRPYCAFLHVCKRCKGSSQGESFCHPNTLTVPDNSTSARDKSKSKNPV